jgi:hypothetical protein
MIHGEECRCPNPEAEKNRPAFPPKKKKKDKKRVERISITSPRLSLLFTFSPLVQLWNLRLTLC